MDRGNKSILIMELEAFPSWGLTKNKGKLAQGTCLTSSLKIGKGGEVQPNRKKQKQKVHTETSTQRVRVAIEVPLHPR